MAKLEDLLTYLQKNNIPHEIIKHIPAYSAHEVAVASHALDKDLAKTLIVHADDKHYMFVIPGDHRLDLHLLKDVLKAKHLHLSQEKDLELLFPDCEVGAMPPFGNLYALQVYIDKALAEDDEIVFNACTHTKSIRMKMKDFLTAVKPTIAVISHSRFEIDER